MRILKNNNLSKLSEPQQFFVRVWYSKTHARSLDTYRVRCMNSRTILRELDEELKIGLIKLDELYGICEEAYEILKKDPVISEQYPLNCAALLPRLEKPHELAVKESKQQDPKKKSTELRIGDISNEFCYAVRDFVAALESNYFDKLCKALPSTIEQGDLDQTLAVTGALLSDLADRGWVLSALWPWHRLFIKKGNERSFEENLNFMLKQLGREKQEFRVILQMEGGEEFAAASEFGRFKFSQDAGIDALTDLQRSFFRKNKYRYFSETTVESNDDISAAILAREKLESVLDLFRFEFASKQAFKISDTAYVVRVGDAQVRMPSIRREVPNPQLGISYKEFTEFAEELNHVREKKLIREEDRRQVLAALRQYRFGRDSEGHIDKFMNWWMGLEDLCPLIDGIGIGRSVVRRASRVLMVNYLKRILGDFIASLKHCQIEWPKKLAQGSGCESLGELHISALVKILQDSKLAELLWEQCNDPLLVYRGKKLAGVLSSAEKTKTYLARHLKHLEWHLARIYRIRCCIVHGSKIRMRLDLITANVEYSLKQVFMSALKIFSDNGHVSSLLEFFQRAELTRDKQMTLLSEKDAGKDAVYAAIFTELVQKEQHECPHFQRN